MDTKFEKEEENNIRNCKTCGVRNEAISHTGTYTNTHRKQLSIYLVYITIPNGEKNTNNLTSYWCYRAYYINDHRTSVELQQNVDVRRDERSSTDNVQWTKIDKTKRKQKTRKKQYLNCHPKRTTHGEKCMQTSCHIQVIYAFNK